jgi:uncharacterized protein YlxW (UPF0749 family)
MKKKKRLRLTKLNLSDIIESAREHSDRLHSDIKLSSTRIEHVRVTARANEAANLLQALENLAGENDNRIEPQG